MSGQNAHKLLTVPSASIAGYEAALEAYFETYRSNIMTFYTVNFSTLDAFVKGTEENPAVFALADVLTVYDDFFRTDGTVNSRTFRQFLKVSEVTEEHRYAWQATSSRLRDDALDRDLAFLRPWGKRSVVPETRLIHDLLCTRMRKLARMEEVAPSRVLPAYYGKIDEHLRSGLTQAEIAGKVSQSTCRPVSQVEVSRFLTRVQAVRDRFAERRFRAAATLEMAEGYASERIQPRRKLCPI